MVINELKIGRWYAIQLKWGKLVLIVMDKDWSTDDKFMIGVIGDYQHPTVRVIPPNADGVHEFAFNETRVDKEAIFRYAWVTLDLGLGTISFQVKIRKSGQSDELDE